MRPTRHLSRARWWSFVPRHCAAVLYLSAALRWTVSLPHFWQRFPRRRRRRQPVGLGHWSGPEPAGNVVSTCLLTSMQARESGPVAMRTTQNPVLVANLARNNNRRARGEWRLRLWNVPGLMDARGNGIPWHYADKSVEACRRMAHRETRELGLRLRVFAYARLRRCRCDARTAAGATIQAPGQGKSAWGREQEQEGWHGNRQNGHRGPMTTQFRCQALNATSRRARGLPGDRRHPPR